MPKTPTVTADQAARAIYLDFEGNKEMPPSLVGLRIDGQVQHFILEPDLAAYATLTNSKYQVHVEGLEPLLERVRKLSGAEKRLVAGFSIHEVDIIQDYCSDLELIQWFTDSYLNAKKPIYRWIRSRVAAGEIPEPEDKTLKSAMSTIGMKYKPGAGTDIVGKNLKRMRTQLATKGSVEAVSKGTKAHWWKILSHNTTDLAATQELLSRATRGS